PNYTLTVKLSSAGAGLDSITINDEKIKGPDAKSKYTFQAPYDLSKPEESRPLATRSVTVNGNEVNLSGVHWNVEKQDVRSATFVLDLGLVRVRKIYELSDSKSPSKGYELLVRHAIENTSQQPVKVKVAFTGPTTPPRESERGPDLQVIAAYDSG